MPYNLRTKVLCRLPQAQANRYGLDSPSFRGSLLWNTLKDEVESWYLDKIQKIDREVGWQIMQLFSL